MIHSYCKYNYSMKFILGISLLKLINKRLFSEENKLSCKKKRGACFCLARFNPIIYHAKEILSLLIGQFFY